MNKRYLIFITLLVFMAGCSSQPKYLPLELEIPYENRISIYLPITKSDRFRVSYPRRDSSPPRVITELTEEEYEIIRRAIGSFSFYGYCSPVENGIYGRDTKRSAWAWVLLDLQ